MAAEIRLTSALGSITPYPKIWLTSAAGSVDADVKTIRLTFAAGDYTPSPAVIRLTEVLGDTAFSRSAPSVVALSDFTMGAAEDAQLDAQETTDGTIVSRAWRQVTKTTGAPDLVLSDYTIKNPTFRAPISDTTYIYILGYSVTDELGLVSEEDFVQITVDSADVMIAIGTSWVPSGIRVATTSGWV